jgi:hypothetical protein
MKIMPFVAAAGIAAAAAFSTPATAQRTVVAVGVGAPAGPGWIAYHDRAYRRGWDGPRYWHRGPHRGYYAWNGGYYQNCSYRRHRHHRRVWHCW